MYTMYSMCSLGFSIEMTFDYGFCSVVWLGQALYDPGSKHCMAIRPVLGESHHNAGDILMMLAQLVCGLASIVRTCESLTRGASASCQPPVREIQLKKGNRKVSARFHTQQIPHLFSLLLNCLTSTIQ